MVSLLIPRIKSESRWPPTAHVHCLVVQARVIRPLELPPSSRAAGVWARAPSRRWWCVASSHGLRTRRVQAIAAVTPAIRPRATCAARTKAALDDRALRMVHCAWRCAHACVPRSVPVECVCAELCRGRSGATNKPATWQTAASARS